MGILFFASWLWLLGVHILGLYLGRREPFTRNPLAITFALSLLKTWPYSFLSYFYPDVIDYRVVNAVGTSEIPTTVVFFNFLYGIFICFFALTLQITGAYRCQARLLEAAEQFMRVRGFRRSEAVLAVTAALALFWIKWTALGGLTFTILSDDLDRRVALTGVGFIIGPADLALSIASLIALIRFRATRSRMDGLLFFATLLLAAFSFSMFGGRKALLQHLIICVVIWKLAGGGFQVFSKRSVLLLAFGLTYFLSILYIRLPDVQRETVFRGSEDTAFGLLSVFLANFSYNDTYYFLLDYSTRANVFLGETFLDLFSAILPSVLYPHKPPIDEGVYVKALVERLGVFPSAPAWRFEGYGSWPPETFGNFVMNFGVLSVWLGGVFLGALFSLGLRTIRSVGVGFLGTYIVIHSALNLQISNLRIVNLLTVLVFGSLFMWIVRVPTLFRKSGSEQSLSRWSGTGVVGDCADESQPTSRLP